MPTGLLRADDASAKSGCNDRLIGIEQRLKHADLAAYKEAQVRQIIHGARTLLRPSAVRIDRTRVTRVPRHDRGAPEGAPLLGCPAGCQEAIGTSGSRSRCPSVRLAADQHDQARVGIHA
jgi:hypothetical protein